MKIPPMTRHHDDFPIRWSLAGLRQIMGQEITTVTHQERWSDPLLGTTDEWMALLQLGNQYPRVEVWQGPWWLFSEPEVIQETLATVPVVSRDNPQAMAIREGVWLWRALSWGTYSNPVTWAIQSFVMLDVWPPDFWRALDAIHALPIRDRIRLDRRVLFLRRVIEAASQGLATIPQGVGTLDCRPLLWED